MIGESYPFLDKSYNSDLDVLFYVFVSQGDALIPKGIIYTPLEKHGGRYYNWGFGDLKLDEHTGAYTDIDDKSESNNGDVKTVFYTVISTLSEFFHIHPDAIVHVAGSNPQRTKVYRDLILRHWRYIEPIYDIKGYVNGQIRAFEQNIDFEYILISRKKP